MHMKITILYDDYIIKGTKPFEETCANGRKTQGIQFTNNQQKTADADQVILGSTADHTGNWIRR